MKVLVTAPYNQECLQELENVFGEVIYRSWRDNGAAFKEEEVLSLLQEHDFDGLITEVDEVSEYVLREYSNLKFIGVCRANPVNVDVQFATAKNIPVFNTPARNAQAVAELFIGNIITFMRNTIPSNQWLKENNWVGKMLGPYLQFKGNELAGKTVGFVGFGAVGQTIANMIKHFPCHIQYYDPFVSEVDSTYASLSLEELFSTSDIVSIHLPVNDATKNLIDEDLLRMMKSEAIFVNTARSAVVDTDALINILTNEKIRGAILDVFDVEPPSEKDYQLIQLPNVLATPHIAGASYEVEDHHSVILNNGLIEWQKGNIPPNLFNKDQLIIKEN